MDYLKAFLVGGAICMLGQILIDKTRLTPARILVCYVVLGVILGGAGVYDKLVDFAGAGATVPLTGSGVIREETTRAAVPALVEVGRQHDNRLLRGGRHGRVLIRSLRDVLVALRV